MVKVGRDEGSGEVPGHANEKRRHQGAPALERVAPPTPEKPIKREWTARSAELKAKNQPAAVPTMSGWRLVGCR